MATVNVNEMRQQSVTTKKARLLATTTKTAPQMGAITPRWLLRMLPWVQVQSGTYRVNRVKMVLREEQRVEITYENGNAVIKPESLRKLPEFCQADGEVVADIASRFSNETHSRGQTIFNKGDESNRFYIIARGNVEISTVGPHGEKLRLAILGAGDHFGETSLLEGGGHNAAVTAITDCELLTLNKTDFGMVLDQVPEARAGFQRISEERKRLKSLAEVHGEKALQIDSGHEGEAELSEMYVDYEDDPQEFPLNVVQSIVRIHTRVSDLYNDPIDQLREQLRLTIEGIHERQEWEIINNRRFGLVHAAASTMRVRPRYGSPTPDDLDMLLSKVWKKPAFFLAHPRAIAAIGRECTWRGVPPATVQLFGAPFITWRGVPIIPCNKLELRNQDPDQPGPAITDILLMRVGEEGQGVIGLHQTGIAGEVMPSLSVRFMGINTKAVASYLVTKFFSCAPLTPDALGVLENVEVDYFHEYKHE